MKYLHKILNPQEVKSLPETGTGRLSFLLRAPGTPENLAASSWPPGAPGARANPPGREEMTG